jgi:hypothetical protein
MEKPAVSPTSSVRDFAYSDSHPLHKGAQPLLDSEDIDDGLQDFEHRDLGSDSSNGRDDDESLVGTYSSEEINRKAVALFDFVPENDNEVALKEGQLIWISYRHGQGWLVAEDPETGENGLVPEEYVEVWTEEDGDAVVTHHSGDGRGKVGIDDDDEPKRFLPNILHYEHEEEEWVDTEDEDETVEAGSKTT